LLLVVGLMHTVAWLFNDRASAKTLMVGRLAMGALNVYDMWTGASPKSFVTPAAVEIGTGLLGLYSLVLAPPAKGADGKLKK
jgi:hypothetical protein